MTKPNEDYFTDSDCSGSEATIFPEDIYNPDPVASLVDWDENTVREQLIKLKFPKIADHLFEKGVDGWRIKKEREDGFREELSERFPPEKCDEFKKAINKLFRKYSRLKVPNQEGRNEEDIQLEITNVRDEARAAETIRSVLFCVAMSKMQSELEEISDDNDRLKIMSKCIPLETLIDVDDKAGTHLIDETVQTSFLFSSSRKCFEREVKEEKIFGEVRLALIGSGTQYEVKNTKIEENSLNSKMPGEVQFIEKEGSFEHRHYLVAIVRCDGEQIEKLFCVANVTAIIEDIDEVNEEMKIKDPVLGDEFTKLATFRKRYAWRFPGEIKDVLSDTSADAKNKFIDECNELLKPVQCLDIKQDHDAHIKLIITGDQTDVEEKLQLIRKEGLTLETPLHVADDCVTSVPCGNFCKKWNKHYKEILPFTPCGQRGVYLYLIYRQSSRVLDKQIIDELEKEPFDETVRKWTSRKHYRKGFKLRAMNMHVVDEGESKGCCA